MIKIAIYLRPLVSLFYIFHCSHLEAGYQAEAGLHQVSGTLTLAWQNRSSKYSPPTFFISDGKIPKFSLSFSKLTSVNPWKYLGKTILIKGKLTSPKPSLKNQTTILPNTVITVLEIAESEPGNEYYKSPTSEMAEDDIAAKIADDQIRQPLENTEQFFLGSKDNNRKHITGEWSELIDWPHIPVGSANLPDGRLLTWTSNLPDTFPVGREYSYAVTWNPKTNELTKVPNISHDMYGGRSAILSNGSILVCGGRNATTKISIFNYQSNTWELIEPMERGRAFPITVALPSDKVFIGSGLTTSDFPELWSEQQGWRSLIEVDMSSSLYNNDQKHLFPWTAVQLTPAGKIFYLSSNLNMNNIEYNGLGQKRSYNPLFNGFSNKGTSVAFEEGLLLLSGGDKNLNNTASTNRTFVINLNKEKPTINKSIPMNFPRKYHNNIVLPDGKLLVVGGNASGLKFSDSGSIMPTELWSSKTEEWQLAASIKAPRNYNSILSLLADGRVLSAGGGLCRNCSANHMNAQIFSPPYLFTTKGNMATRPVIMNAPILEKPGGQFTVKTSLAISKFSLIRLSSIANRSSTDQRYLNIAFKLIKENVYKLKLPTNPNILTPGYYWLFALNPSGVPSIAKTIKISLDGEAELENPGEQLSILGSKVNLPITVNQLENEELTFTAENLPSGLKINPKKGLITGVVSKPHDQLATLSIKTRHNTLKTSFRWIVFPADSPPPAFHQFAKLVMLSEVNGNPWSAIADFNLLDDRGDTLSNRSTWIVTADSEETNQGNGRATNLIDGHDDHNWLSSWSEAEDNTQNLPHEVTINLGKLHRVGGFEYLPRQDSENGRIAEYLFFLSKDGKNWRRPVATGIFPNSAKQQWVTFKNKNSATNLNQKTNDKPEITNPGMQSAVAGSQLELAIATADNENDFLVFNAEGLPPNLSIDRYSGIISGYVLQPMKSEVSIEVRDGTNLSKTSFNWDVTQHEENEKDAYQYVKFVAESDMNGGQWTTVAEFNLLDGQGHKLERSLWKIKADSEEVLKGKGQAQHAIDGNKNSLWITNWSGKNTIKNHQLLPHSLTINLGGRHKITAFQHLPRQKGTTGEIADYSFYVSKDGKSWGNPVAQGIFPNNRELQTIYLKKNKKKDQISPNRP